MLSIKPGISKSPESLGAVSPPGDCPQMSYTFSTRHNNPSMVNWGAVPFADLQLAQMFSGCEAQLPEDALVTFWFEDMNSGCCIVLFFKWKTSIIKVFGVHLFPLLLTTVFTSVVILTSWSTRQSDRALRRINVSRCLHSGYRSLLLVWVSKWFICHILSLQPLDL